jgi:hypothetical protein
MRECYVLRVLKLPLTGITARMHFLKPLGLGSDRTRTLYLQAEVSSRTKQTVCSCGDLVAFGFLVIIPHVYNLIRLGRKHDLLSTEGYAP